MNGYAGFILQCDLSRLSTTKIPIASYANTYLGGRGLASRLYWEQAAPQKEALDPANPLIITTGPLAGFSGLAGSRWAICSKSPSVSPQTYSYSNFGGSWGPHLKMAGFDALIVRAAADKPMYLFLHDGICEFRDARHLWGKGAAQTRQIIKPALIVLASAFPTCSALSSSEIEDAAAPVTCFLNSVSRHRSKTLF